MPPQPCESAVQCAVQCGCLSPRPRSGEGAALSAHSCVLWRIIAVGYERERPRRNTSSRPQPLQFSLLSLLLRARSRGSAAAPLRRSALVHMSDGPSSPPRVRAPRRQWSLTTDVFLFPSFSLIPPFRPSFPIKARGLYSNHCCFRGSSASASIS